MNKLNQLRRKKIKLKKKEDGNEMRKNHSDGGIKGLDTNVESMRRKKDNGRQQKKKKKLRHFLVLLVVGKTE